MLAGIAFVGIATVQQWWRYNRAKDAAASWLQRHHYRVQSLSMSWSGGPTFKPSVMRDSDKAFGFHAVVDDMKLGGTGKVAEGMDQLAW